MFLKSSIIITLLLTPLSLSAAEKLDYLVEYKGMLSGYSWTDVSRATIETVKVADCSGRGSCMMSRTTMSSRGYAMLEAIFKVRFHYRSFYRLKPARTLAFEMREKKYSDKYQPYGYKHSLTVIPDGGTMVDFYKLWSKGEPLPESVKQFVATDHKPAGKIRVKKVKRKPVAKHSIDRLALLQIVRSAALKKGYTASFPGTNGKNQLEFRVAVIAAEEVKAAGKRWKTWKIRVDELEKGDDTVSLFAWVSRDSRHIPVKIEIDSSFGSARFILK